MLFLESEGFGPSSASLIKVVLNRRFHSTYIESNGLLMKVNRVQH